MNIHNVILYPLMTEKTETVKESLANSVRYSMRVDKNANKELIRQALHKIYNVTAVKINTMIVPGKDKKFGQKPVRKPAWKKAIVTLAPGQKIDFVK